AKHAQLPCRGKGYVDDAPADKGPAVIDAHRGAAAIEQVGHTQPGTEGQSGVGGGHVRLVVGLAAGGAPPVQTGGIVARTAFGGIGQPAFAVRQVGTYGGGTGQQEQGGKHCPHRQPQHVQAAALTSQGQCQDQPSSFCLSSCLTCCGLALRLDAFIAWPTKKPNIWPRLASSLARYCSTWVALA